MTAAADQLQERQVDPPLLPTPQLNVLADAVQTQPPEVPQPVPRRALPATFVLPPLAQLGVPEPARVESQQTGARETKAARTADHEERRAKRKVENRRRFEEK